MTGSGLSCFFDIMHLTPLRSGVVIIHVKTIIPTFQYRFRFLEYEVTKNFLYSVIYLNVGYLLWHFSWQFEIFC